MTTPTPQKFLHKFRYKLFLFSLIQHRKIREFFSQPHQSAHPPKNILICGLLLLGDLVLMAPLFQALKQEYPNASITLLIPPGWEKFSQYFLGIDHIVEAKKKDLAWLKNFKNQYPKNHWDLGIVPWINYFVPIFYGLGVKQIRAFPRTGDKNNFQIHQKINLPEKISSLAHMSLKLSHHPQNFYPAPHFNLTLIPDFTHDARAKPYIVIHPGASNPTRIWNLNHYAQIATTLNTQGYEVVLTGIPSEKYLADEITQKAPCCKNLAGKTQLHDLLSILKNAELIIGPDTGVLHLARALNKPSITLMGPTPLDIYGPDQHFHDLTLSKYLFIPDLPCRDTQVLFNRKSPDVHQCKRRECLFAERRCLDVFQAESVLKLARELLTR